MRKLLLLLPLFVLLTACQSHKETCARLAALEIDLDEAVQKLRLTGSKPEDANFARNEAEAERVAKAWTEEAVERFCAYYKN